MWLMLDTGFISIVAHDEFPDLLQIRSRVRQDLLNTLPVTSDDIIEINGADYQFRVNLPRADVAQALLEKVMGIDYTSHVKDVAVSRSAPAAGRSEAYYACWTALAKIQPKKPYEGRFSAGSAASAGLPAKPAKGAWQGAWPSRRFAWEEEALTGSKEHQDSVCRVSMPNAWDICDECGHASLVHPGQNDVDGCVICDIEDRWL